MRPATLIRMPVGCAAEDLSADFCLAADCGMCDAGWWDMLFEAVESARVRRRGSMLSPF